MYVLHITISLGYFLFIVCVYVCVCVRACVRACVYVCACACGWYVFSLSVK